MKIVSRNCTYFRVSEYSRLETLVVKATKKKCNIHVCSNCNTTGQMVETPQRRTEFRRT